MQKILESGDASITEVTVDVNKSVQFFGASVENDQPISYPLSSVEQLLSWKAHDVSDRGQFFSVATVPHNPKIKDKFATQTLLCHDMKGGYLPDSHNFVTIPPVGWVNAGHRNGITVLGTFITEFKDGYERCFYDASDGIFLNYCWQEENLNVSKLHAKNFSCKIYVGVDVFGRGTFGGGGFNTNMALQVINKYNMSVALFAPGWIYEKFGPSSFEENCERFWSALQPYCFSYPINCPNGLESRFNPGGECGIWTFINCQDLMPLLPQQSVSLIFNNKIRTGKLIIDFSRSSESIIRLFKLNMSVVSRGVSLLVPSDVKCCFVLETNQGVLKPEDGGFVLQPPQSNTKVIHFTFHTKFTVTGICISADQDRERLHILTFIGLFPNLLDNIDFSFKLSLLTIKDIDWKEEASKEYFIFGGTLCFNEMPKAACFSEVSCIINSCKGEKMCFLGVSVCSAYRVHELEVPNPKYCGPDCSITFIVRHMSGIGMQIGKNKLVMIYAKNFKSGQI